MKKMFGVIQLKEKKTQRLSVPSQILLKVFLSLPSHVNKQSIYPQIQVPRVFYNITL